MQETAELLGFLRRLLGESSLGLAQRLNKRLRGLQALGDGGLGRRGSTVSNKLDDARPSASLHHHDRDVTVDHATGDDHLEHGVVVLLVVGKRHPLSLGVLVVGDERHPHSADRAGDGQARKLGRGGRAVNRDDVVVLLGVHAEHCDDNLDLVAQPLDKGRAQRAIDETAGQDRLGGGAALAAEERARDLARGVHALLNVDGQREEVDVVARVLRRGGRGQQHRVLVEVGRDRPARLARELPRFKTDGARTKVAVVEYRDSLGDAEVLVDVDVEAVIGGMRAQKIPFLGCLTAIVGAAVLLVLL